MSQGSQLSNLGQYDLDIIVRNINSVANKLEGLSDLQQVLNQGCSTASFLGSLEKLFAGLRQCLLAESTNIEIVLKANNVLLDMIQDIQHSDELEIQYAQLIPIFVDNLGSPKAVVRKSTHKCIATYVKISKKLEFVMLHLVHTGLDSANTRTRQHSMLVIPALLSLKPSIIERPSLEIVEMLSKIIKRVKDGQEIVAKTARKLIVELQKCYPAHFESCLMNSLRNDEEKLMCKAILRNDDDEIQKLINQSSSQYGISSKKQQQEEIKQQNVQQQQPSMSQQIQKSNQQYGNELSIVGREILQNTNASQSMQPNQAGKKPKDLERIINEAKEESRYPMAQNGLFFGFLDESLIEQLNENNQWKERTNSIEAIESKLNLLLQNEKKMDFFPYATAFLGFMLQYIPDINFKISLTTIKIINKLLQANIINFKKYYVQLVTQMIEKLADSKVIIRQQVLKCCSLIISNHKASIFCQQVLKYLQHGNWHVREGALNLVANCILTQPEINSPTKSSTEQDIALPLNQQVIGEICQALEAEDKQKIQALIIDVLALAIDVSPDSQRTVQIIQKCLNITSKGTQNMLSKEQQFFQLITERLQKGNLPYINEEGIVDFPSTYSQSSAKGSSQQQISNNSDSDQATYETLASSQTKTPSKNFMEVKKREEDKKTQQQQQIQQNNPYVQVNAKLQAQNQNFKGFDNNDNPKENDKIQMWLPSFTQKEEEAKRNQNSSVNLKGDGKDNLNATSSSVATMIDDG